ncbi:MAG: band 7 protein [Planctomycetia bacterium]|nr:band 7 protein [Planctomycetia bacterium]
MSQPASARRTATGLIVLLLACAAGWEAFEWTVNRISVPVGSSLLLQYKGPLLFGSANKPKDGQLASLERGEIGVIEQMPGPGRHFYCPIWWDCQIVKDQVVAPGEVAVVTSLVGKDLNQRSSAESSTGRAANNQFLVDGDFGSTEYKGVLRKVYGPGRYRVNPYAYEFKKIKTDVEKNGEQVKYSGWVEIKTGYVGVVTNQTDNPLTGAKAGIQPYVLPPGLYPMNPREQKVDIVEIGYREKTIISPVKQDAKGNPELDASGEPSMAAGAGGIVFPSKDGFTIHMDFTAIWGIMPDEAPHVVEFSGTLEAVETRVVVPLIESICRNEGSKLGAVDLLVGDSREQFQDITTQQFEQKLRETGVVLQYGLVRHIYIPQEVRVPIQKKYVADELKLTRDQEQLTARTEANLREAERKVELEAERIRVETEKLVAEKKAEGDKTAAETGAETLKLVATIARQTAELDREATVTLGEAEASAQKLMEEAKAGRFKLAVSAFGTGDAFNQWVFASGLPDDIQLQLLYAGDGTFWTDLKGFSDTMLAKQAQEARPRPASAAGVSKK